MNVSSTTNERQYYLMFNLFKRNSRSDADASWKHEGVKYFRATILEVNEIADHGDYDVVILKNGNRRSRLIIPGTSQYDLRVISPMVGEVITIGKRGGRYLVIRMSDGTFARNRNIEIDDMLQWQKHNPDFSHEWLCRYHRVDKLPDVFKQYFAIRHELDHDPLEAFLIDCIEDAVKMAEDLGTPEAVHAYFKKYVNPLGGPLKTGIMSLYNQAACRFAIDYLENPDKILASLR
jgi:hypothetical protein